MVSAKDVNVEEASARIKAFTAAIESDHTLKGKSKASKALAVQIMNQYDRNKDGEFSLAEVVDIEDIQEEKTTKNRGLKIAGALSGATLFLFAALVVLAVFIVVLLRDYDKSETNKGSTVAGTTGRMLSEGPIGGRTVAF